MSDRLPDLSTPEVRDFWKSVYLAVIRCDGQDHDDAVACADMAVTVLIERAAGEPDSIMTTRKVVDEMLDRRIGCLLIASALKDKD